MSSAAEYLQCFLCRDWGWTVCGSTWEVQLCLPCYVDVLETRQLHLEMRAKARGVMTEEHSGPEKLQEEARAEAGHSPSPLRQMEMFEPRERYR